MLFSMTARAQTCPEGCAACSGLECTSCAAGYYKTGIRCVECPDGTWAGEGATECSACSDKSYANVTCTACTKTGKCTAYDECRPGYYDDGYDSWGKKCAQCPRGTYSSTVNASSCTPCPAGTRSSSSLSSTTCIPCVDGMWSSAGGVCQECSTSTKISVPNGKCEFCSPDGEKCTGVRCNTGYVPNGTTCVRYTGSWVSCPDNCDKCSADGTCLLCRSRYFVQDGKCEEMPVRENVEFEDGICNEYRYDGRVWWCVRATCLEKNAYNSRYMYAFLNKYGYVSQRASQYCMPAHCKTSTYWGKCVVCGSGYVMQNGKCVPECKWNEYRDASGQCQPCSNINIANGVCRQCSADGTKCTDILCDDDSYSPDYESNACVKPVVCKYPLKEVADYSGDCVGCCTE